MNQPALVPFSPVRCLNDLNSLLRILHGLVDPAIAARTDMYCRFSSKLSHSEIQKRLAESQLIPIDPNWESTILMPDDDDHHDYWAEGMLEETMGGFVVTLPVRPAEGNLWVRDEDVSEQFRLSRIRRTSEWRDAWRLAIRLNVRLCGGLVHQLDVEEESRNDLEYVFREVRRIADRFGFDFASPPEWVSASPKPDEESEERSLGDLLVPAWIADLNERPPITVELVDEMYRDLNFLYCGYELYRRVRRGSFTDDVRELRDGGAFIPVGHFKLSTHELPRRCEFQTDADGKPARLKCRNCGWEVRSLLLAGWNSTAGVYRACGASERSPHLVEGFKNSAEYWASGSIEVDPPPPLDLFDAATPANCEPTSAAIYYYSDVKKWTKLERTAIARYIELAGLPKTKVGQRDRSFSEEEKRAILNAVKRCCPIKKHREAAVAELEKLPP